MRILVGTNSRPGYVNRMKFSTNDGVSTNCAILYGLEFGGIMNATVPTNSKFQVMIDTLTSNGVPSSGLIN